MFSFVAMGHAESKSLWHQLAESLLLVDVNDRDRFLDYCLKRRIMCDKSHFQGPKARFRWVSGILRASKVGLLA